MSQPTPSRMSADEGKIAAAWGQLVRPVGQPPGAGRRSPDPRATTRSASERPVTGLPKRSPSTAEPVEIEVLAFQESVGDVELYHGWDLALQRNVTIRSLNAQAAACSASRDQFWKEARWQARLSHPRLVAVHTLVEARHWAVTERTDHTVAQELQQGKLAATRVRLLLEQALEGLIYIHSQGQVHGQIHPGALLIDDFGDLKIDRPLGIHPHGEFLWRPGLEKYLAPETLDEAKFGPVGPAVDLYSLGMTLLELLAGDGFSDLFLPRDAELSDAATAWQKWHVADSARLAPIGELLPKTPPGLSKVLDRMLEKRVDRRFATAQDAWAELNNVASPRATAQTTDKQSRQLIIAPANPRVVDKSPPRVTLTTAAVTPSHDYGRPTLPPHDTSRMAEWAERLTGESAGNTAAVALLLVAMVVAGLTFFAKSDHADISEGWLASQGGGDTKPASVSPSETESDDSIKEPAPPTTSSQQKPHEPPKVVAPPPPAQGVLVINVSPPDAVVTIGGKRVRGSARVASRLDPGKYQIEVLHWQYQSYRSSLPVVSGKEQVVTVRLERRQSPSPYEPVLRLGSSTGPQLQGEDADTLKRFLQGATLEKSRYHVVIRHLTRGGATNPLAEDPWAAHALALVQLELGDSERTIRRFEHAAALAPFHYTWPRKHLIRDRMIVGDYDAVLQHVERLYQSLAVSKDFSQRSGIDQSELVAYQEDTGRFLGIVSGLLDGPCGARNRLTHLESRLYDIPYAQQAYDESRRIVLQHYNETGPGVPLQRFFDVHLRDLVVAQQRVVLASMQTQTLEPATQSHFTNWGQDHDSERNTQERSSDRSARGPEARRKPRGTVRKV